MTESRLRKVFQYMCDRKTKCSGANYYISDTDGFISKFSQPEEEKQELMDDSTQYKVVKWKLSDMNKYNGEYAVIGFDGALKIYESEGKKIFDGSLLDSSDFCNKLREKM